MSTDEQAERCPGLEVDFPGSGRHLVSTVGGRHHSRGNAPYVRDNRRSMCWQIGLLPVLLRNLASVGEAPSVPILASSHLRPREPV